MCSMTPKAAELARCAEYYWEVCWAGYSTTVWWGWTLSEERVWPRAYLQSAEVFIMTISVYLVIKECSKPLMRWPSVFIDLTHTYCGPIYMMLNSKCPFLYGGIDWMREHDIEFVVRLWYFYPIVHEFPRHDYTTGWWPLSQQNIFSTPWSAAIVC